MEGEGMEVQQIRRLKPMLRRYLSEFDGCFGRKDTRGHLSKYVEGQLSDLERKSVEPIALKVGVPVRTLQEFLSQHRWDAGRLRDRLQEIVIRDHAERHSIGLIDETSFVKKGDKTPGVQRQHCGAVGKQENCIVTVHLGYSAGDFHCLLDADLFLPEGWSEDRERCREAGIPDEVVYRPKSEIALELYDRATANGVTFEWLTFDEWYGAKPQFLRALDARGQKFVAEVHKHYTAWIDPPRTTERPYRRGGRGRGKKAPRLVSGSRPPLHVEDLLKHHSALRDQAWEKWRVKDGEKGPVIWEVKHTLIYPKDENGLPGRPYHLIVARNVLHPDELKYFVSNAPPEVKVAALLLVAFSRWRIERCFEDQKGEVGLDHFEGRRWLGLQRHLAITAVSYLFLARAHAMLRGEKSGVDPLPGAYRHRGGGEILVAQGASDRGLVRPSRRRNRARANKERPSTHVPHQGNSQKTTGNWHQTQ
jgi:SRSO17 transposase